MAQIARGLFIHGSKSSIGTTAVALASRNIELKRGVLVKAAAGNSGTVYVGIGNSVTAGSTDATDGFELSAGDSVGVESDNLNQIFVIASEAGQKVFWIGI